MTDPDARKGYADLPFWQLNRAAIRVGCETKDNRLAEAELRRRGYRFNASAARWESAPSDDGPSGQRTDPDAAALAAIREHYAVYVTTHDRYWGSGAYSVRSDASGGCNEDLGTMHEWEHWSARRDFEIILQFLAARDQQIAEQDEQLRYLRKNECEIEALEAKWCPEDMGFDEYIPMLLKQVKAAEARLAALEQRLLCNCGELDPQSARHGNGHLAWCATKAARTARS